MRTTKNKLGIFIRREQAYNNAPPPSAKLGLPAARNLQLMNPAEDKRSNEKLRLN
jgi:hypothetical protein